METTNQRTQADQEFPITKEFAREDVRGKFLTAADLSDFYGVANFQFNVTAEEKSKTNPNRKTSPFHKLLITMIVHEPNLERGEKKTSFQQFLDVDVAMALAHTVLNRQVTIKPEDKYGTEFFKAVGFVEKRKEARQLSVKAARKANDPSKVVYAFEFQRGAAVPSSSGTGFTWTGTPEKGLVFLPEDQTQRFMLEIQSYLNAKRAATYAVFYDKLFLQK